MRLSIKLIRNRIVAYGYSAGGHLVAMLATTTPEDGLEGDASESISTRVSAVVCGGAPCEFSWLEDDTWALNYWLGAPRSRIPETWRKATPLEYISRDDPPFLFFPCSRRHVGARPNHHKKCTKP